MTAASDPPAPPLATLDDLRLGGAARVLVRVDFNVPLGQDGAILDDARIAAALPTLRHVVRAGAPCIVMTHLGRPGGRAVAGLEIQPVATRLARLLHDAEVRHCDAVTGPHVQAMAQRLRGGEVLLLQNLRFDPGEARNDQELAEQLAKLGDVYINDAFAVCHRKHASVNSLPAQFASDKRAAGRLLAREVSALDRLLETSERPFVAVFGGAKVADKLGAVGELLQRVDEVLIGGAMAYTFLRARGDNVGASPVDHDHLDDARAILREAGNRVVLPRDHVVVPLDAPARSRTSCDIPDGHIALDIGPETAAHFAQAIERAAAVVWNGPMGKVEEPSFFEGTRRVVEALANCRGLTVVGGGETGSVVRRLGVQQVLTHLSTGGGAFLEYIARGTLPALELLRRSA